MALGSTEPLTEMSTRNILGGKGGRCVRLTTLLQSCAVVTRSGNLNFLESSGPLQVCNGTALHFFTLRYSICAFGSFILALSKDVFMCQGVFRRWREGWSGLPGNHHPSLHTVWITEGPLCSEEFLFQCHFVKHRSMWELRCCDQILNVYFLALFTSLHIVSTIAVLVCLSVSTHTKS